MRFQGASVSALGKAGIVGCGRQVVEDAPDALASLASLTSHVVCAQASAGEIARVALKRGLIKCTGKTPEATMASAL